MLRSLCATLDEMADDFKSFTESNKICTDPEEQARQEMQGFMTVFVKQGQRPTQQRAAFRPEKSRAVGLITVRWWARPEPPPHVDTFFGPKTKCY